MLTTAAPLLQPQVPFAAPVDPAAGAAGLFGLLLAPLLGTVAVVLPAQATTAVATDGPARSPVGIGGSFVQESSALPALANSPPVLKADSREATARSAARLSACPTEADATEAMTLVSGSAAIAAEPAPADRTSSLAVPTADLGTTPHAPTSDPQQALPDAAADPAMIGDGVAVPASVASQTPAAAAAQQIFDPRSPWPPGVTAPRNGAVERSSTASKPVPISVEGVARQAGEALADLMPTAPASALRIAHTDPSAPAEDVRGRAKEGVRTAAAITGVVAPDALGKGPQAARQALQPTELASPTMANVETSPLSGHADVAGALSSQIANLTAAAVVAADAPRAASSLPPAPAPTATTVSIPTPGFEPSAVMVGALGHLKPEIEIGPHFVRVQLRPEELGGVDVALRSDGEGAFRATLTVDRPETLQLLQRDASLFGTQLAAAGFPLAQGGLTFTLRQEQRGTGGRSTEGQARNEREEIAPLVATATRTRLSLRSLLDLEV